MGPQVDLLPTSQTDFNNSSVKNTSRVVLHPTSSLNQRHVNIFKNLAIEESSMANVIMQGSPDSRIITARNGKENT